MINASLKRFCVTFFHGRSRLPFSACRADVCFVILLADQRKKRDSEGTFR